MKQTLYFLWAACLCALLFPVLLLVVVAVQVGDWIKLADAAVRRVRGCGI